MAQIDISNGIFTELFVKNPSNWILQLFRYTIVGGFAFIIDYSLLYFLTESFEIYYLISATISFIVGLVVNYILSILWIFKTSKYNSRSLEFIIFGIIGVAGLGLNALLLYIATDILHIYYMISKLLVACIIMLWNFICRKLILFTTK